MPILDRDPADAARAAAAIPGPQEPCCMSLPELALALSLAEPGSPSWRAVHKEMRRRLGDRSERRNHSAAAMFLAGAMVAVTAFYIGAMTRGVPPQQHKSSLILDMAHAEPARQQAD